MSDLPADLEGDPMTNPTTEYHRHTSGDVVPGPAERCIDPDAGAHTVLVMTPREFAEHLAAARTEEPAR